MIKVLAIILGVTTLALCIAILVAVGIGLKAKPAQEKIRSLHGSIRLRDDIMQKVKFNSNGRGNLDKIKEAVDEWQDLKKYERFNIDNGSIEVTGFDLTND